MNNEQTINIDELKRNTNDIKLKKDFTSLFYKKLLTLID